MTVYLLVSRDKIVSFVLFKWIFVIMLIVPMCTFSEYESFLLAVVNDQVHGYSLNPNDTGEAVVPFGDRSDVSSGIHIAADVTNRSVQIVQVPFSPCPLHSHHTHTEYVALLHIMM